jgi:hypothetical protein
LLLAPYLKPYKTQSIRSGNGYKMNAIAEAPASTREAARSKLIDTRSPMSFQSRVARVLYVLTRSPDGDAEP